MSTTQSTEKLALSKIPLCTWKPLSCMHHLNARSFCIGNRFYMWKQISKQGVLCRMLTGEYCLQTYLSGRTRQEDYYKALQPRQRILHEALYMGWTFSVVPSWGKGPGLSNPTSANLLVTPGKMNDPEGSSFLWLKWFAERNTTVNNQLSRLYVWQLEDRCLEAEQGIWVKYHRICHLILRNISELPSLPRT